MDDITESLNILVKKRADVNDTEYNEVLHIIQSFPVNENSLTELENWLMNSEKNKTALVCLISS